MESEGKGTAKTKKPPKTPKLNKKTQTSKENEWVDKVKGEEKLAMSGWSNRYISQLWRQVSIGEREQGRLVKVFKTLWQDEISVLERWHIVEEVEGRWGVPDRSWYNSQKTGSGF